MSQIVYGHEEILGPWVAERMPTRGKTAQDFAPFNTIGVFDGHDILAVALFNNYVKYDIMCTFAASTPRWATRGNIQAILAYPFFKLGLPRLTCITGKKNRRTRRFLEGIGFDHEGTHPCGLDGIETAISYGLLKKKAMSKWFNGGHNG